MAAKQYKACHSCGNLYTAISPSRLARGRFCSKACSGVYHSRVLVGENNPGWKGGRFIASSGYVKVFVGRGHPHAYPDGYALEHRVIVSASIGRPLTKKEVVHHLNGDKADNRLENLELLPSNAAHLSLHHSSRADRRMPGEPNVMVACACGCGSMRTQFSADNVRRNFIWGHNNHEKPCAPKGVGE